jgi:hypothetical protein
MKAARETPGPPACTVVGDVSVIHPAAASFQGRLMPDTIWPRMDFSLLSFTGSFSWLRVRHCTFERDVEAHGNLIPRCMQRLEQFGELEHSDLARRVHCALELP